MLSVTSGFIKQWGQPNSVVRGKNVVKRQIGCLGTPKLGYRENYNHVILSLIVKSGRQP